MKATATLHSILHHSQLLDTNPVEYRKSLVQFHKTAERLKNETESMRANIPDMGKSLYALRVRYQSQQALQPVPPEVAGRTFPDYAKSFLGIDGRLNNHAESVANSCRYIAANLITELDFDLVCAGGKYEAPSRASRILTLANDDFEHVAVLAAAELLKTRPANLLKALKAIIDKFVEVEDPETAGTKKMFLTDDEMAERESQDKVLAVATALDEMAKCGNLTPLFAAIEATARTTDNLQVAREIVHAVVRIREALAANVVEEKDADGKVTKTDRRFTQETLQGWVGEIAAPVPVTKETKMGDYLKATIALSEIEDWWTTAGFDSAELDALVGNEVQNELAEDGKTVVPKS